ncbi:9095_t:CDS:2 [Cetraspora pellucida]|uniref:9095_t:CDS:1 n=1 Tax=Cetraspora pellucida TaxID=1433469 RepID=A0ACA9MY24_9GLOM|nr:9095_t:CDS:2 [Cetraspora pellucida]
MPELRELEAKYNYILPNSPTQKAGQTASPKFRPVARQNPMLSLDSIDGLSVSLVYRNHHLAQISTRGNGIIGEDITFNKELLKNVPFFLKEVADCEVRGEVYMKKEEFLRLNEELKKSGHKLLANPRNAAAGSLRTLVPLQNRNLHFFAYQLFNSNLPTQLSCLQELEKLGFAVSHDYRLFRNVEEVGQFIQQQEKKRESLDFESDGIVVKVDDYRHYEKLGQTSRFPRLNIGDEIVIKKAGDVIPQITKVIKLNDGASLDIKGISTKNIQKLYENNLLNQPADFYRLYQKERQLLKLEGFRKKSVGNMLHSIENSKKRPLANLLTALGIPLLSSVKTQKLTKFYPDLSSFLTAVKNEE